MSTLYAAPSTRKGGHLSDDALLVHIKAIYAQMRGAYGWPRIWRTPPAGGIRVGKQCVQKLMRQHGIRAKGKRRFKVTTDSNHDFPIAPDLPVFGLCRRHSSAEKYAPKRVNFKTKS